LLTISYNNAIFAKIHFMTDKKETRGRKRMDTNLVMKSYGFYFRPFGLKVLGEGDEKKGLAVAKKIAYTAIESEAKRLGNKQPFTQL